MLSHLYYSLKSEEIRECKMIENIYVEKKNGFPAGYLMFFFAVENWLVRQACAPEWWPSPSPWSMNMHELVDTIFKFRALAAVHNSNAKPNYMTHI